MTLLQGSAWILTSQKQETDTMVSGQPRGHSHRILSVAPATRFSTVGSKSRTASQVLWVLCLTATLVASSLSYPGLKRTAESFLLVKKPNNNNEKVAKPNKKANNKKTPTRIFTTVACSNDIPLFHNAEWSFIILVRLMTAILPSLEMRKRM